MNAIWQPSHLQAMRLLGPSEEAGKRSLLGVAADSEEAVEAEDSSRRRMAGGGRAKSTENKEQNEKTIK